MGEPLRGLPLFFCIRGRGKPAKLLYLRLLDGRIPDSRLSLDTCSECGYSQHPSVEPGVTNFARLGMIQEAKQCYRGVLCNHCRQPIPLPAAVARRGADGKDGQGVSADELSPKVFTLRCRACQGEGLYTQAKFIDVEGTPRVRHTQPRKASPMVSRVGTLSRAANG